MSWSMVTKLSATMVKLLGFQPVEISVIQLAILQCTLTCQKTSFTKTIPSLPLRSQVKHMMLSYTDKPLTTQRWKDLKPKYWLVKILIGLHFLSFLTPHLYASSSSETMVDTQTPVVSESFSEGFEPVNSDHEDLPSQKRLGPFSLIWPENLQDWWPSLNLNTIKESSASEALQGHPFGHPGRYFESSRSMQPKYFPSALVCLLTAQKERLNTLSQNVQKASKRKRSFSAGIWSMAKLLYEKRTTKSCTVDSLPR